MPEFDLAVIGADAAGLAVAAGAAQLGASVLLVADEWTSATRVISRHALLAVSRAARSGRDARFGVTAGDPAIAWGRVRSHMQDAVNTVAPVNSESRLRALGASVLRGEAKFVDPATIAVDGRTITARRFVVATGCRPAPPAIEGLQRIPFWTIDSLTDIEEAPNHLLILGGGSVGLELADGFAGLGSRVTLIEPKGIAADEDPELVAGLRQALAARSIAIREGVGVTSAAPGPILLLADGTRIEGSDILITAMQPAGLGRLNVAAAGLRLAASGGIATDRGLRSVSNRRVYAAGAVADPVGVGSRPSDQVATYHAGIILRRILFRLPARLDRAALPRITSTDPGLAQAGRTEAEADAAGMNVQVLRWPLADNDLAIAEGNNIGLVKLIVRHGRVVGAGILAPGAGETISQWTLAISQRIRLSALAALVEPYPTRAAAATRAASSFYTSRFLSPRIKALVRLLSRLP